MTLLELVDVTVAYAARPVLDLASLSLDEGELAVVCGATGSGKSTLLGVVSGLVPTFTGGSLTGDVLLDGESVLHLPARERAGTIGYVAQDPAAGFVTDTVEEELAYGMEQLGLAPAAMRRRVEETLDLLGIADLRARDLRTLSGGQQQRVAIGSVLAMHPRLLVLDEPTSALDPTAAEEVLASLTRLVHDLGLSVLVAEHRLERVLPFADRAIVVGADGVVQTGVAADVMRTAPLAPPIVELGRLAGWTPLPLSVREARRAAAPLRMTLGSAPARVPAAVTDAPGVATAGLTVTHGRTVALRQVDLTVHAARVTAVMGRNGSGKSTLLSALHRGAPGPAKGRPGTGRPAKGRVLVGGADPTEWSPEERRRRVGLVPQSFADLLYLETVGEECAVADAGAAADAAATRSGGSQSGATCQALLQRFAPGISPDTHPRDLSEGQRLALVLAIVLTSAPGVLLLDEPTRGLDYAAKAALRDTLRELAAEGRTVVVATHDVEFVAGVADDVVVLAEGEVISSGPMVRVVEESPSFAPQVTKVLGSGWVTVEQVAAALGAERGD